LWLITCPPFALAALPPVPIAEDDWVGVVDSAPSPSEDAEVPPEAALPPEPTTPLALPGLTLAAPVPTVDADIPPAGACPCPPAWPCPCASPVAAEPATNSAAIALNAHRLVISRSPFREFFSRERLRHSMYPPCCGGYNRR